MFGPEDPRKLKRCQGRLGDIWHLDEVFVKIRGQQHVYIPAPDSTSASSGAARPTRGGHGP